MQDGFFHDFLLVALAILLLVAAFTDIRRRQIDNWLNLAVVAGAPLFWWASGLSLWPDIGIQLGMAAGVFLVLAALFAFGAMGGGDVKLLSALALWLEPGMFLRMLVVMAIVGGILTIVMGAWHVMRRQRDKLAIPYGVAIAAAGIWILGIQYLSDTPASASLAG
ncbi:MAG: prepilin peptidase [Novosphingobium sp.]|nr:prepilin peptidase [Novosphingobium sp.]